MNVQTNEGIRKLDHKISLNVGHYLGSRFPQIHSNHNGSLHLHQIPKFAGIEE